jgi:uncharacterized protein (TIRG00374 family)
MNESHARRSKWRLVATIVTFIALGVLIYATRSQIGSTFDNLGKVNSWALLLIIPLQALNYYSYANLYRYMLAILDVRVGLGDMYKVALELNFVNNVFPSGGVSSFSYFTVRMKQYNVPTAKSTLIQFMRFILVFISFQILLFVGLLTLAIGGQANDVMILIASSLATLLLGLTLFTAYVVGSKTRINNFLTFITKVVNRLIHVVRPNHPETINISRAQEVFIELHENYVVLKDNYKELKKPLLFALGANITEIATIYVVYIAFGQWVNPGAVIIAYAIANFAGLISVLPGGIGIYEGLTTAVLVAAGIPAGLGLSVTIMYRVLSMTLQVTPGWYLYYRFMHKAPAEQQV